MRPAIPVGLLAALWLPPSSLGADPLERPSAHRHGPPRSYVHGAGGSGPVRSLGGTVRIPPFARLYGTGCSTCHTAAPKLNVLGEAFRLAGYVLPDNDVLVRRDAPVPLGAEPWKDQWPRAVWPSDVPGIAPLALRVQTDLRTRRVAGGGRELDFRFPHEVYLLAGAPLGDDVAAFVEVQWSPDGGVDIVQAKVAFQDFLPGLPSGAANLWVGRQDPFLLTFTDRQIDRAGVVGFSWQRFRLSQLGLTGPSGAQVRSANALALGGGLSTVEINGVLGGRLHYGIGVSQGASRSVTDNNGRKDPYYRVRYKLGGLDLRGRYDPGGGPVLGSGGQLQDRSLILEHFGYRGSESTSDDPQGPHWALGAAARVLYGPWDVGAGWVRREFERPFDTPDGTLRGTSLFAKVEYLALPWLMGSLKLDRLDVSADAGTLPVGFTLDPGDRRTLSPGAVLLVRQNVRAVVEGRFFLSGDAARAGGADVPADLFIRLDVAF